MDPAPGPNQIPRQSPGQDGHRGGSETGSRPRAPRSRPASRGGRPASRPSHFLAFVLSLGAHGTLLAILWIAAPPTQRPALSPRSVGGGPIWVSLAEGWSDAGRDRQGERGPGNRAASANLARRGDGQPAGSASETVREDQPTPGRTSDLARGSPARAPRAPAVDRPSPAARPLESERASRDAVRTSAGGREASQSERPARPAPHAHEPQPRTPTRSGKATARATDPGARATTVAGRDAHARELARGDGAQARWPGAGDVDRPARPRRPIRPHYPAIARRAGRESTVVVEAWVDGQGQVAFSSVLDSGGPDFDRSALDAVFRSSFRPARLEGRDVPSRVALRIHFALRD